MSITVAKVNISELSTEETMAVRVAEEASVSFYGAIDAENTETLRLQDLIAINRLMVENRNTATQPVIAFLNNNKLFTETEKNTLIMLAGLSSDSDPKFDDAVSRKFALMHKIGRCSSSIRVGYTGDFHQNTTEMLARAGMEPTPKTQNSVVTRSFFSKLFGK